MHGADVLLITSPNLPNLTLDVDTSRGKRTTQLDLNRAEDSATLLALTKESDVFLQAYRPGGLEAKGFGVEELARVRPGIVYASLTVYGWEGPWKDRRGVRQRDTACGQTTDWIIYHARSSILWCRLRVVSTTLRQRHTWHSTFPPSFLSCRNLCLCKLWIMLQGTSLLSVSTPLFARL